MQRHFVTFLSPGTFVAEDTTRPIESWDSNEAMQLADGITERYGATPYGFYFTTRSRGDDELDSKVTAKSKMYFLGGKVKTLAQVIAGEDPKDGILISNMRCNDWDKVIVNENSWQITQPFQDGDTLLDYVPPWKRSDGAKVLQAANRDLEAKKGGK